MRSIRDKEDDSIRTEQVNNTICDINVWVTVLLIHQFIVHTEILRFVDAPSHVTAITFKPHFSSQILTSFQNKGKSWIDVAPVVAKLAKLNLRGLTMLRNIKTRMREATVSTFSKEA